VKSIMLGPGPRSALAFACAALFLPAAGCKTAAQPAAISVFAEGEDSSSVHYHIFFRDKRGRVVRIVNAWNGGCCKRPTADEFRRKKNRFPHFRSFRLKSRARDVPAAIICNTVARIAVDQRSQPKPATLTFKAINEYARDAKPFSGCRQ